MEDFIKKFIEEATDLINALESSILSLENNTQDKELINEVFRIMHSLKGGGAMFGFSKISNFTHNMENIYDEVRSGNRPVTKQLLDVTLASVDHLRNLLSMKDDVSDEVEETNKKLSQEISGLLNSEEKSAEKSINEAVIENKEVEIPYSTYYIQFKPNSDIFNNGSNPLFILEDLNEQGKCQIFPITKNIPHIGKYNYSECYTYWKIIIQTNVEREEINDTFIFVEDDAEIEIKKIANEKLLENEKFLQVLAKDEYFNFVSIKKKADEILNPTAFLKTKKNKQVSDKIKKFTKESEITSIRISTDKIDQYMNYVSELVTAHATLRLYAEKSKNTELDAIAESIGNITEQVRENALSISLIPIENTIIRFKRLVRDLSADFGKQIDFITEGTDTRIDKTLLQIITDPLMHIIRNSIDHGIEAQEKRVANGKPAKGTITLRAYHSGSNVNIEIEDDGAGINISKVEKKAIEKGLISVETKIDAKEAQRLIFMPGFSTTEVVSDISGRGVGMDVLKRKIADARGDIELDSIEGEGTKITLKLPLTLSIIDGLLVKISESFFIIPLSSIAKIKDVKSKYLLELNNNIAVIDGEQVPFFFLKKEFEIDGEYPEEIKFIMIKYEKSKVGFVIDSIEGEYQAVLKPLGKLYRKYDTVSGASILGDGTVALVLDTNKIIKKLTEDK